MGTGSGVETVIAANDDVGWFRGVADAAWAQLHCFYFYHGEQHSERIVSLTVLTSPTKVHFSSGILLLE